MKNDLYPDPIKVWAKNKTHEGHLLNADISERLSNPLCGDRVNIEMKIDKKRIVSMAHQVRGCLLCKAASAHLAFLAVGHDAQWLKEMYDELKEALKTPADDHSFPPDHVMFEPVRTHQSRRSCVLLPYETAIHAFSTFYKKI